MSGTDLTQIDGVDAMTAMTSLSEEGLDMGKWKTVYVGFEHVVQPGRPGPFFPPKQGALS